MKARLTSSQIRKIIQEELAIVIGQDDSHQHGTFIEQLAELVGRFRGLQLWFHAAHHVVSGSQFAGDHGVLYDRIYTELEDEFDNVAEKVIGVTNDTSAVCPLKLLACMQRCLGSHASPVGMSADALSRTALQLVKEHISYLESLFDLLESSGKLSLGLNDFIAAQANTFETYVYLLQQRTK